MSNTLSKQLAELDKKYWDVRLQYRTGCWEIRVWKYSRNNHISCYAGTADLAVSLLMVKIAVIEQAEKVNEKIRKFGRVAYLLYERNK